MAATRLFLALLLVALALPACSERASGGSKLPTMPLA